MVVVGLIPARGGSRPPGKNLAPVGGKPLLAWTIEAARRSTRLTRVVVSTDNREIADEARRLDAEVLDRPAELSADDTPMLDVVVHALEALTPCDVLVLLQPTSPLRRAEHIDDALVLLQDTGADTVVSVVEVPHQFRPGSLMRVEDGRAVPADPQVPMLRQQKPVVYARNGPAVLVVRPARFDPARGFFAGDCRAYVMDPRDSIDVDGAFELELADCLLRSRSTGRGDGA